MTGNMSPTAREELQDALERYTTDTFTYMDTVREFCEKISKWMLRRESELQMMMEIKERADRINLNISHLTKSGNKGKAFLEYLKSKVTQVTADSRLAELEKELAAVLKDTLQGLQKLDCFLDAVEKLAVTSLHVFVEDNQELAPPKGICLGPVKEVILSPGPVKKVILATWQICPLLLEFKRDASVFFLPRLKNIEVLAYQLDNYIRTTQKICKTLEESSSSDVCPETSMNTVVDLDGDFSEDDVQRMLCHINQLDDIRENQNFRMVFLFKEMSCSGFIGEFSERRDRMLQFLKDLEEPAVQLDRMNMGAKISSVAGSSVGALGGVLSIVGLALIPVTLGVSIGLTAAGIGLGVTSGVNGLVTAATEIGVNRTQQNKANELIESFIEDAQILQDCLEEVMKGGMDQMDVALGVGKVVVLAGCIGRGIDAVIDATSAAKILKNEELITSAGKVAAQEGKALRNVPRLAADVPDVGQVAVKGPLALSQSARAGLMVANALFLGLDVFLICKDSISLYKGSETEFSHFIRARVALWSSEMDSWQKIHDSLCEGQLTLEGNRVILDTPFYPVMKMNKRRGTRRGTKSDGVADKPKETQWCVLQ